MLTADEQMLVEGFVQVVVRDVWPAAGIGEEAKATAAWSLYATTMANLQILAVTRGSAALQASHRQALLDHCEVIKRIAECRTEAEVLAHMGMEAETKQERGSDSWRPAAEVKG